MRILLLSVVLGAAWTPALAQETTTYTYDVHGRLIGADRSTGADTDYAYDDGDSRTSKVTTDATAFSPADDAAQDSESDASAADSEIEPEPETATNER